MSLVRGIVCVCVCVVHPSRESNAYIPQHGVWMNVQNWLMGVMACIYGRV